MLWEAAWKFLENIGTLMHPFCVVPLLRHGLVAWECNLLVKSGGSYIIMYSRSLSAPSFAAEFPPDAPKFNQCTLRVRLINLITINMNFFPCSVKPSTLTDSGSIQDRICVLIPERSVRQKNRIDNLFRNCLFLITVWRMWEKTRPFFGFACRDPANMPAGMKTVFGRGSNRYGWSGKPIEFRQDVVHLLTIGLGNSVRGYLIRRWIKFMSNFGGKLCVIVA